MIASPTSDHPPLPPRSHQPSPPLTGSNPFRCSRLLEDVEAACSAVGHVSLEEGGTHPHTKAKAQHDLWGEQVGQAELHLPTTKAKLFVSTVSARDLETG
ncbi:hypothetical protein AMTR_s00005p00115220 [Amborella trichopoda]|uniref:Uncharacterized protein n=1 Tax=Amborella trichopoda TaxID=13333 RepID=W1PGK5_AMBTC|nr:hypothetical protein AMTR_s00005p00115220 [Amborella trichopoda]